MIQLLLRIAPDVDRPERVDVIATIEAAHTVGDLATALGRHLGVAGGGRLVRVGDGTSLIADRLATDEGIASGDELGFERGTSLSTQHRSPAGGTVLFTVEGGPRQGWSSVLAAGVYRLGSSPVRPDGAPTALIVDDPTIRPAQVTVAVDHDLRVTIDELEGATNPLTVNGERVPLPAALGPNDVLSVGDSSFRVREPTPPAARDLDQLAQVALHRSPFRPSRPVEVEVESVDPIPSELDLPQFSKVGAVAPVAGAAGMALLIGNPTFLWFAALAPITGFAGNLDQRRRTRRRHVRDVARFRTRLEARRERLASAVRDERLARRLAAPDLADLRQRAESRAADLWCRGRDVPEFLTLRLGNGDVDALVKVPDDRGGDDVYLEEVAEVGAPYAIIQDVPITLALAELGVLGLLGRHADVTASGTALTLQAVCLHSPEDLVVATSVTADSGMASWLKWLPHTRATGSPIDGPHLAVGKARTDRLLRDVLEVAEFRAATREHGVERRWPWVLLILDRRQEPDPALVAQLLAHCPAAGISVIWLTDRRDRLPPQCRAVVEVADRSRDGDGLSKVWFTDPDIDQVAVRADGVDPSLPGAIALALAPLRDASSATQTSSIPGLVPLFAAHQVDQITSGWVEASWAVDRGYALTTTVGVGAEGPLVIDLVEHGPHGLIGGTSGSGKSELLQTLVAGLVASHGPEELNLLFIDFKGGSASDVFRDLPHVAGRVTDLDEALALRAQVALRAELRHRAQLFAGRAKDIAEMRERFGSEAPPSLVIVIDEFATLVKTLPNFVHELVDIAQRGRSYGLHLLLATQRPSAAVDDNIRANTNLRISLRMLDKGESNSVLDSPEAAQIPVPLKGRALARLGPGELVEFQSAFCGAPQPSSDGTPPIIVGDFDARTSRHIVRRAEDQPGDVPSQIDALIGAVIALGRPRTRQVWNEELPTDLNLASAVAYPEAPTAAGRTDGPGRVITIGVVDDPERQAQYAAAVDLEAGGGLLVFGGGGSGRTEALRTIAQSAAADDREAGGGRVLVYVLDFAGGGAASPMPPQCAGVGGIDDLEAATRILAMLSDEVSRRRAVDPRGVAASDPPRILLLIDGYPNLVDVLTNSRQGQEQPTDEWLALLHRIVLEGRRARIHTVMTADRAGSVRTAILAGVTTRLVLRQPDDAEARDLGAPSTKSFAPGGGYLQGLRVQVARTDASDHGDEVDAPTAARIEACRAAYESLSLDDIELSALTPEPRRLCGIIGVADITAAPVTFDLTRSDLLVTGPPRSGRSTALLSIASQLEAGGDDVFIIGAEDSRLRSLPWSRAAWSPSDVEPLLGALRAHLGYPGATAVLVVDDLDLVEGGAFEAGVAGYEHNRALRIVASTTSFPYPANDVRKRLRGARQVLYLQPGSAREVAEVVGVLRLPPLRLGLSFREGRGLFMMNRVPTTVQVVDPTGQAKTRSEPDG